MPDGASEPDELLTRAELLERLAAINVEATEADLRYWEYEQISPRPVRQRHAGATRAVYPAWIVHTISYLRALQAAGLALRDIAPLLRESAPDAIRFRDIADDYVEKNLPDQSPEDRAKDRDNLLRLRAKNLARMTLLASLDGRLLSLAADYLAVTDNLVDEITVTFRAANGEELDSYTFNVQEYFDRNPPSSEAK